MKVFEFTDNLEQTFVTVSGVETEDEAWAVVCDSYGTGYVFENLMLRSVVTE